MSSAQLNYQLNQVGNSDSGGDFPVAVSNKKYWEIPDKVAAYEKYVARRNAILSLLAQDFEIKEISDMTGRSTASIYTDIAKVMFETDCNTYWGLLMRAITEGWIPCPLAKPHVHEERPPCPE